ncbi:hypothetical protein K504DRAFT_452506 [Pleomassaria siparia CBS 279.74]|uniref:Uncharacterized protein n=1 Tax=Pleomassaria siparia CBS 279.74 TaxID=1314801 RepID=A0A6G1KHG5_9PLEO|nr:hypothetical protein K504DRAFT_452506 [Pleomassaria siparia CBS 279.74]
MQPASGRRALSGLANKLHPQLPLTNRQSQHLLTLLTTSFRDHLDREYPVSVPDSSSFKHVQTPPLKQDGRNSQPSSQSSASTHIDSILNNPLFSTRPRRKSNSLDAREALRDPLGWFKAQIATGAATFRDAELCMEMWEKAAGAPGMLQAHPNTDRPGFVIAQWLQNSGEDCSKEFVNSERSLLLTKLVPVMLAEGVNKPLWQWLKRKPELRVQETGLDASRVLAFRTQLLKLMVASKLASEPTLDPALAIFRRAGRYLTMPDYDFTNKILQPTGANIVRHIFTNSTNGASEELYDSLLQSVTSWSSGPISAAIQSILWLHHPTRPTAAPGLAFLRDPKGAIVTKSRNMSNSKRQLLVQLCLGVAQKLLSDQKLVDAQFVMGFTQQNFPDFVLSHVPSKNHYREHKMVRAEERGNLEMLNQLLPG